MSDNLRPNTTETSLSWQARVLVPGGDERTCVALVEAETKKIASLGGKLIHGLSPVIRGSNLTYATRYASRNI
ncbi:hypothetical protein LMH87_006367 [Akanthomyces muscarius]|uniref:Uncharacterized protein n=1 Tax=Akanthomyces muscarius TaxID=2231603 RepID=A0A9W8QPF9_AKAMU|nr:hypothetical protein LMH87_006367 [Akanthomyces muscarius]KAJ4164705.1 hypothetical protein LMH87_006367 [Akanthomyces muscarius]